MTEEIKKNKSAKPVVFSMSQDQCVWAKAGVVKAFTCINAFDCLGCAFDKKIQEGFARKASLNEAYEPGAGGRPINPRMKMLMSQGKCRHMLSGRVAYKLCSRGYDCARCPYDQMLDEATLVQPLAPPNTLNASGFTLGRDHYYHRGHTWARVEYGGRIRVGVDDFALRLLGPMDEIKLPKLGATVAQGRPQAVLRRERREAETASPVDGVVVARNQKIMDRADTANESPYHDGWLMVIQPTRMQPNLKNLLFGDETTAWFDEEAGRLSALVAGETGHQLTATGGELVRDIYGAVPELGWDRLVNEFLIV